MTQRWNPPNYQDLATQIQADPSAAGRSIDQSFQLLNRQLNALPQFADSEVPRGVVDASNRTFTLAQTPNPTTSLHVYSDGLRTTAYRLINQTLTMTTAPTISIVVDYRYV